MTYSYKTKKTIFILSFLLALGGAFAFHGKTASALSGSDFQAGNIISDSIFFNPQSMTPDQIQNFMNAKVPTCDNYGTQYYGGGMTRAQYGTSKGYPPPYTCLKGYAANTPVIAAEPGLCGAYGGGFKSSAQMIYDIAQVCSVNPQILLVVLQKEQALVTDDWPWSIQFDQATGYGCPDSAPCDATYAGFFNQVYQAARGFRKYALYPQYYNYRAGQNNSILYSPLTGCGASNIYIQNQATAGLYIYTPYQPNAAALSNLRGTGDGCSSYGNRNFWVMFNDWFGSTQGSSLVRTPTNGTYYLLTGGNRYAIPNMDIVYAYGLQNMSLGVVSDSYLSTIPDGGLLSTTFVNVGDPTVYMADNGNKFGIASSAYCTRWGLDCTSATQKILGPEITDRMANRGTLQALMKFGIAIYLMENGTKRQFLSPAAMQEQGYGSTSVSSIASWTNALKPYGTSLPQNNSFVKFASGPTIYLYTGGSFFTIPDYDTFQSWRGPNNPLLIDTTSSYNTTAPTAVGSVNKYLSDSGTDYLVDGGGKVDVGATSTAWPAASDGTTLQAFLSTLPVRATATSTSTYRLMTGAIYSIENGTKRPFNSLYDFNTLRSASSIIYLNSASLPIPDGAPMLAPGSAYKVSGSNGIYMVSGGNNSYLFTSLSQINDFQPNTPIPTISPTDASAYTYQTTLQNRVTDSAGTIYLISNGRRYPIAAQSATAWGFSTTANAVLPDQQLARLPLGPAVTNFISTPSGTIYTPGSGAKLPIGSYQKYLSLGGNSANTLNLNDEVVSSVPTGSVIY